MHRIRRFLRAAFDPWPDHAQRNPSTHTVCRAGGIRGLKQASSVVWLPSHTWTSTSAGHEFLTAGRRPSRLRRRGIGRRPRPRSS